MLPFEHYLLTKYKLTKIMNFTTNLEDEASFSSQVFNISMSNICTRSYSNTSVIFNENESPQSNTGLENEFSSAASDNTQAGAQGTQASITTPQSATQKDNTKHSPILDNGFQDFKETLNKLIISQSLRNKGFDDLKFQLLQLSKGNVKELQQLPKEEESHDGDQNRLPSFYKSEILDINKLNSIDFVLQSIESQDEIDSLFNFKMLQFGKNIVLLAIEYSNINIIDDDHNTLVSEISQYISTMIYQFAVDRIRPKNTLISDVDCIISIEKDKNLRDGDDLHKFYKNLVSSGKLLPITPVQFDFYFNKSTIFKFAEFIVLSSLSNVSINSDLHSVLPYTNSISKRNFSHYSRDRNCLSSESYTPDVAFDFEVLKFTLEYDQFMVEMYVRTMLLSKVPDYIPLITRGQWSSGHIKSLEISTPYLNNYFVKFDLSDYHSKIDNFVLDIICQSKNSRLDKNFRNKTRLTLECPKMFNRFILSDEPEFNSIHDEFTIPIDNE